jgi:hypothetical protein
MPRLAPDVPARSARDRDVATEALGEGVAAVGRGAEGRGEQERRRRSGGGGALVRGHVGEVRDLLAREEPRAEPFPAIAAKVMEARVELDELMRRDPFFLPATIASVCSHGALSLNTYRTLDLVDSTPLHALSTDVG